MHPDSSRTAAIPSTPTTTQPRHRAAWYVRRRSFAMARARYGRAWAATLLASGPANRTYADSIMDGVRVWVRQARHCNHLAIRARLAKGGLA